MAGKYGSNSVTVAYDDAQGGSARTVTSLVLSISGIKIVAKSEIVTAYGDTIEKMLPTGVKELPDIDIEGMWDTTATTGSHAVFGTPDTDPNGGTRTLTMVLGDSKTWTSEGYLKEYEVLSVVGQIHKFKAKLGQVSGAWS
jgi:hypothetical protein